jgi:hypothetical protein
MVNQKIYYIVFFFLRMIKVKRCKRKSKRKTKIYSQKSDTRLDLDCLFPGNRARKRGLLTVDCHIKDKLCMCIGKCYVFSRKHGLKRWSHNEFKGTNEEFCSCSNARRKWLLKVATTKMLLGSSLRTKTPYLDRGDDNAKMKQLKGIKSKTMIGPTWRKGLLNWGELGPGRSAHPILMSVRPPFLEREGVQP